MKNFRQFACFLIVIFACCSANAKDNYSLKVSLKNQVIGVFHENALIKQIPCSTGVKVGSTPVGEFTTHSKKEKALWVEEDGSKISYYYITRFNKYISFHSLLEGDHFLVDEGARLYKAKKPSSMGCVRVSLEDAKWIYDLPLGVSVLIEN